MLASSCEDRQNFNKPSAQIFMLVKQQATGQYGGFKIDSIGKQFIIIKHHLTKRLSGIQEQLNNEQSSIKEYLVYYDPNIY